MPYMVGMGYTTITTITTTESLQFNVLNTLHLLEGVGKNKKHIPPNAGEKWWFTMVESKKSPDTPN